LRVVTEHYTEIKRFEVILEANSEILHPCVIDSCMENAFDMGLREDADDDGAAFWAEVVSQLKSEMDAEGLL
jgi:hypothetical protein